MRKLLFPLALMFIAVGCVRDFSTQPIGVNNRPLNPLEKRLVSSSQAFGVELFKELVREDTAANVFCSPFSVSMALGMTLNGAAGETESAMRRTLGFESFSQTEINETYKSLIDLLSGADPKVVWTMANSIWHRDTFSVLTDFLQINRDYFCADVRSLQFSRPDAVDIINGWISDKTNDLIKDMIDSIPPDAVMYLINAVYFKGIWTAGFDSSGTKDDRFNGIDGQSACRMMGMEHELFYAETQSNQIVEMPYGDGRFGMVVVLPRYGKSTNALTEGLTPEAIHSWMTALTSKKINLFLPKFTMLDNRNLKDALTAMGMGVAFSDAADFIRINPTIPLAISRVLHKAYVSVDESGTEAAAATVVEIEFTSAGGGGSLIPMMRVDRPFLFFIHERSSGAILFAGKVNRIEG